MKNIIYLHIEMEVSDRMAAIDRRDEIIEALKPLGIRPSIYSGLQADLVDKGVPSLGDYATGRAPLPANVHPVFSHFPPASGMDDQAARDNGLIG